MIEPKLDVSRGERRVKQCSRCGEEFACYAGGCWCDSIALSDEQRARLIARFDGCLCARCLSAEARRTD